MEHEWTPKVWGRVAHVWASPEVAISYLELVPGTRSSWHLHSDRYNTFCVTSGRVIVEIELHDLVSQIELKAGRSLVVEPGRKHRFRVMARSRMVEVYWCDEGKTCREDDILRFDSGGNDDQSDLHT